MKRHAETRKRFQALYSMSSLLSFEPYVDDCIDLFLDKLNDFARSGNCVDLAHWLHCYAFDVIGKITYVLYMSVSETNVDFVHRLQGTRNASASSTRARMSQAQWLRLRKAWSIPA